MSMDAECIARRKGLAAAVEPGGNRTVCGLVALAAALRLYRLDYQSLWIDEVLTVHFGHKPVPWLLFESTDVHPSLYYLLVKGFMEFHESVFAIRLISVAAGTATVWFVYRLGRELFDVKTGLAAAALTAISPFQIWYSQEARMYALLTLLLAASSYVLVRALATGTWTSWTGYAVLAALALYTHHAAVFTLGAHGCYALLVARSDVVTLRRLAGAAVLATALYVPGLVSGLRQLEQVTSGYWIPRPGLASVAETLAHFSSFMLKTPPTLLSFGFPDGLLGHLVEAAAVALCGAGIYAIRCRPTRLSLPILLLAVPLGGVVGYSLVGPISIYQDRVLIGATIGFLLLLARGATIPARPTGRVLATLALALVVLCNIQSLRTLYVVDSAKHPFKQAIHATTATMGVTDALLLVPEYLQVLMPLYSARPDLVVDSGGDERSWAGDHAALLRRAGAEQAATIRFLYLAYDPDVIAKVKTALAERGHREVSSRAYGADVYVSSFVRDARPAGRR